MTGLPNADLAFVDDGKLGGYLLDPSHKSGWPKGQFLIAHGFSQDEPEAVRQALLAHALANDIAETELTGFGVKYRIDGPLPAPGGVVLQVRTVWQIDTGQTAPRFVTMVPLPRRS